jgi:hypothetical protein
MDAATESYAKVAKRDRRRKEHKANIPSPAFFAFFVLKFHFRLRAVPSPISIPVAREARPYAILHPVSVGPPLAGVPLRIPIPVRT